MAGKVTCSCGKQYTWKPELAGRRAKCKQCGAVVTFPATDPAGAQDEVPEGFEDMYAGGGNVPPPPPPPPMQMGQGGGGYGAPAGMPMGGMPGGGGAPVPIPGAKSVGASRGFSWGALWGVLLGLGLIGFGIWQFVHLSELEQAGPVTITGRRAGLTKILYGIGGKWAVAGFFALIGLFSLVGGVMRMMGKTKEE